MYNGGIIVLKFGTFKGTVPEETWMINEEKFVTENNLSAKDVPGDNLAQVRRRIAASVMLALLLLGLPPLLAKIINEIRLANTTDPGGYIGVAFKAGYIPYYILIILFIYRKKIPLKYLIFIFLTLLILIGCQSIFYYGFIGISVLYFIMACALGALFLDGWRAFIPSVISIAAIAAGGFLWFKGIIGYKFDPAVYAASWSTYFVRLASAVFFITIIVGSIRAILEFLIASIDSRDRLDEELQRSESKYRNLIENSADIIYSLTSEGIFNFVSPAWTRFLGHAVSEVEGNSFRLFVHPDDMPACDRFLQQVVKTGEREEGVEYRVRHKNGDWHWHTSSASPYRDPDGRVTGFYGIARDITDRRKAEEELRLSRAQLQAVLDSSLDAITVTNKDGIFLASNKVLQERWGRTREQIIGHNAAELLAPDIFENRVERVRNCISSGLSDHFIDRQGDRWFENTITPIVEGGKSASMVAMFSREITGSRHAEQELRTSEQRFRGVLEGLEKVAVQGYEPDGTITFWNRGSELVYGFSSSEALGRNILDLLHGPETRDEERHIMDRALLTGEVPPASEVEVIIKSGNKITIYASRVLIRHPDGPPEFFCIDVDISERKKAEADLRESETRLAAFMENVPALVLIKDSALRPVYMNRRFLELLPGLDWMGKTPEECFPPEVAGPMRTADEEALAAGYRQYEETWTVLSGEQRDYETRKFRIERRDDEPYLGAFIFDITERRRIDQALRESESKFRSIIESSPVGYHIYKLETDGRLVFTMYNQAADTILHVSHEQFIGLDIVEAFPALAGTGIPEMYRAIARGESGMENFEVPYNYAGIDGIYEVRVFRGDPSQTVVNFIDITDRKKAEEEQIRLTDQLHQSQKMDAIGQLAGGVAHDFNNLIGGITGSAQLLQYSDNLSEKQKNYIAMILTAAERAGNLTKKLLKFSRSGAKVSSAVDCVKVINDTVEILQHTIDRNITISVENSAKQTSVIGDDTLLQNALMNLGINASQAMPQGGSLTFSLENINLDENYCELSAFAIRPGGYVQIAVRDTGCGMPPEVLTHVFEPFFTTKEQGKGTGLGLSIVYGTVQEHGGEITVKSEPGAGTVFYINLPVTEEPAADDKYSDKLTSGSGTVLLIDDDELIRITARDLLESLGYTVLLAVNGEEGVKIFSEKKELVDLVILDMIMPVMGGRDTFEKLRAIDPAVTVLIASGFAREENMMVLKEQGISGFIQKPFRLAELAEKVHDAMKQ